MELTAFGREMQRQMRLNIVLIMRLVSEQNSAMEANQRWTAIMTLLSRPWLLVGSLVDVPLRDAHGRDRRVTDSTVVNMLCFVVFWREKIENEKESGERVSQPGTWQQCVLPLSFHHFPSESTDPTRVAAS
jgi:hypothetical protein